MSTFTGVHSLDFSTVKIEENDVKLELEANIELELARMKDTAEEWVNASDDCGNVKDEESDNEDGSLTMKQLISFQKKESTSYERIYPRKSLLVCNFENAANSSYSTVWCQEGFSNHSFFFSRHYVD